MSFLFRRGAWAVQGVPKPGGGYSCLLLTGRPGAPISACQCVRSRQLPDTRAAAFWAEAQFAAMGA